jgi:hypothetical protein
MQEVRFTSLFAGDYYTNKHHHHHPQLQHPTCTVSSFAATSSPSASTMRRLNSGLSAVGCNSNSNSNSSGSGSSSRLQVQLQTVALAAQHQNWSLLHVQSLHKSRTHARPALYLLAIGDVLVLPGFLCHSSSLLQARSC